MRYSLQFLFLALLCGMAPAAHAGQSADAPNWEMISDADYAFFMRNPALPWGKDPFRRKASGKDDQASDKPVLQGISQSRDHSVAVINGEAVAVGDRINGRRVVEIGSTYVVLEKKSSLIQISLPPSSNAPAPASAPSPSSTYAPATTGITQ